MGEGIGHPVEERAGIDGTPKRGDLAVVKVAPQDGRSGHREGGIVPPVVADNVHSYQLLCQGTAYPGPSFIPSETCTFTNHFSTQRFSLIFLMAGGELNPGPHRRDMEYNMAARAWHRAQRRAEKNKALRTDKVRAEMRDHKTFRAQSPRDVLVQQGVEPNPGPQISSCWKLLCDKKHPSVACSRRCLVQLKYLCAVRCSEHMHIDSICTGARMPTCQVDDYRPKGSKTSFNIAVQAGPLCCYGEGRVHITGGVRALLYSPPQRTLVHPTAPPADSENSSDASGLSDEHVDIIDMDDSDTEEVQAVPTGEPTSPQSSDDGIGTSGGPISVPPPPPPPPKPRKKLNKPRDTGRLLKQINSCPTFQRYKVRNLAALTGLSQTPSPPAPPAVGPSGGNSVLRDDLKKKIKETHHGPIIDGPDFRAKPRASWLEWIPKGLSRLSDRLVNRDFDSLRTINRPNVFDERPGASHNSTLRTNNKGNEIGAKLVPYYSSIHKFEMRPSETATALATAGASLISAAVCLTAGMTLGSGAVAATLITGMAVCCGIRHFFPKITFARSYEVIPDWLTSILVSTNDPEAILSTGPRRCLMSSTLNIPSGKWLYFAHQTSGCAAHQAEWGFHPAPSAGRVAAGANL